MTEQASGNIANSGPVNTFGHGRVLLGPEVEFVAPNNDPLYSNLMAGGDRSHLWRAAGCTGSAADGGWSG